MSFTVTNSYGIDYEQFFKISTPDEFWRFFSSLERFAPSVRKLGDRNIGQIRKGGKKVVSTIHEGNFIFLGVLGNKVASFQIVFALVLAM